MTPAVTSLTSGGSPAAANNSTNNSTTNNNNLHHHGGNPLSQKLLSDHQSNTCLTTAGGNSPNASSVVTSAAAALLSIDMEKNTKSIPVQTIGCPAETYTGENRLAQSPDTVQLLSKKGFRVLVEFGAGERAKFPDCLFEAAGAKMVDSTTAWSADAVVKVRIPSKEEVKKLKDGAVLISFAYPSQNQDIIDLLAQKRITFLGMDCIPRISRAQVFDALSSMANIAGYRAIVEASHHFGRFLGGQMTAAGRIPPAKVLIIGGGVAGLSAIATAKNMGAIARCFDTRPAVKEQVESLGGEFLEVTGFNLEEGQGGYAKEMSREFIEAEMALFAQQAREVDIIVTTALIPGKPAPRLITKSMVESMKCGSVIVDLAAEMGGNCESTKPKEVFITPNGVTCIGYTDLPSHLPTQSTRLYSNNISKFVISLMPQVVGGTSTITKTELIIDLEDEVTRGSLILQDGTPMWPPPRPVGPPPSAAAIAPKGKDAGKLKDKKPSPFRQTFGAALGLAVGTGCLIGFNLLSHDINLLSMITIFALAGTAGYQGVWGVTPALHTPLMSVTNAISGITVVGGILMMAAAKDNLSYYLAAIATTASCVNIFGGFLVTKRMLDMFKRSGDAREHNYLYVIPALTIAGIYCIGKYVFHDDASNLTYLAASLCCIMSIGGLASQKSSRFGNSMGMVGIFSGVVCTLGLAGLSFRTYGVCLALMGMGALVGVLIGGSVQVTELPQTVAAFHSLVGLAAMVTSVAHFTIEGYQSSTGVNLAAAVLGNLIGGITLTGSVVAFGKLHGLLSSKALSLPGKNSINITLICIQLAIVILFCAPGIVGLDVNSATAYSLGLKLQWTTSAIALFLGFHLVASVGGGDMPVCITVLNSYSGWALVAEGFMLQNLILTIVGSLIGFSGGILSYIMCVAMNRSLANVLFGGYAVVAKSSSTNKEIKTHRETTADEVTELLVNAREVMVVPGYGMAVAKAQYAIADLARTLRSHNVNIRFAIHPVAGRMPGQMNVLLAEAGVPYDWVFEMEEVNSEFPEVDVALVIGANDITNAAAQEDPTCSIAGMPVLEVWKAKTCVFMKRSMAAGYADLENPVFFKPNTLMLLGDGKATTDVLANRLKNYYDHSV